MEEKALPKKKTAKSAIHELYDWTESILAALIAVIIILVFVVRTTRVEGGSMLPTLHDSEFLAITHLYSGLKYNDIVVIYAKNIETDENEYGKPIIKRVIGLPGDTIYLDSGNGVIYRNDEALPTEYRDGLIYEDGHVINDYTRSRGEMPEGATWTVPEYHIFVLGDNRNYSKDSRNRDVGMVDQNYVIGRVILRITPFDKFGMVN
ncbi:MAG: signal peptidase I [Oscillospiraceae bacterium]|jgi:signal peptidase I|nr:signal peptidase I [Oscillospiraceae bacterium]